MVTLFFLAISKISKHQKDKNRINKSVDTETPHVADLHIYLHCLLAHCTTMFCSLSTFKFHFCYSGLFMNIWNLMINQLQFLQLFNELSLSGKGGGMRCKKDSGVLYFELVLKISIQNPGILLGLEFWTLVLKRKMQLSPSRSNLTELIQLHLIHTWS